MNFDIRLPIGVLFLILGGLLCIYGIFTAFSSTVYEKSLHLNVNIIWGAVLLVFGAFMLFLFRRAGRLK